MAFLGLHLVCLDVRDRCSFTAYLSFFFSFFNLPTIHLSKAPTSVIIRLQNKTRGNTLQVQMTKTLILKYKTYGKETDVHGSPLTYALTTFLTSAWHTTSK